MSNSRVVITSAFAFGLVLSQSAWAGEDPDLLGDEPIVSEQVSESSGATAPTNENVAASTSEETATTSESSETSVEDSASTGDTKSDNITAVRSEGGRYFTKDDVPTYKVSEDGKIDWPSYSGFRRYHSECHVCHGPEGEGSSYAPALKNSAIDMDYYDFIEVVASGRVRVGAAENSVMPAFGTNKNVMCYLDDIYVYLKGRGTDAIPRGRPRKREDKSDEIRADEADCIE